MPQIDLCLNKEDKISFFDYIFSHNGFIIVDDRYNNAEYVVINERQGIDLIIEENVLFYIGHKSFFKSPLALSLQTTKNFYYIKQRYGGPVLHFFHTGSLFNESNNKLLGYGSLSYYASCYSTDGNSEIRASQELKAFYKLLCTFVKKESKLNFNHFKRKIWLGNGAFEEVCKGVELQDVNNESLEKILNEK